MTKRNRLCDAVRPPTTVRQYGAGNRDDLPLGERLSEQTQCIRVGVGSTHRDDHCAIAQVEVQIARYHRLPRHLGVGEERKLVDLDPGRAQRRGRRYPGAILEHLAFTDEQ